MNSSRPNPVRRPRWLIAAALLATALVPLGAQAGGRSQSGPPSGEGCPATPEKCYAFSLTHNGQPAQDKQFNVGETVGLVATYFNLSRQPSGIRMGASRMHVGAAETPQFTVGKPSTPGSSTVAINDGWQFNAIQVPPGGSVTIPITFTPAHDGQLSVTTDAIQADAYNPLNLNNGQELVLQGTHPTLTLVGCQSNPTPFSGHACNLLNTAVDGETVLSDKNSAGETNPFRGRMVYKAVTDKPGQYFTSEFRSDPNPAECPVPGSCPAAWTIVNLIPSAYPTTGKVSMEIQCVAGVCDNKFVWFQLNGTNVSVLPPCPLPSLLGGKEPTDGGTPTCITPPNPAKPGFYEVLNLSYLNDYKVMGFTV